MSNKAYSQSSRVGFGCYTYNLTIAPTDSALIEKYCNPKYLQESLSIYLAAEREEKLCSCQCCWGCILPSSLPQYFRRLHPTTLDTDRQENFAEYSHPSRDLFTLRDIWHAVVFVHRPSSEIAVFVSPHIVQICHHVAAESSGVPFTFDLSAGTCPTRPYYSHLSHAGFLFI